MDVEGDAALRALAAARHWPGTGAPGDPIRIEGQEIRADAGTGVRLAGTRLHVVVRAINASGGGDSFDGVVLEDVRNVTVEDSTFEGDRVGVRVERSADVKVLRNGVTSSRIGVKVAASERVLVEDNRLSVNDRDVLLDRAQGNVFRRNNLSIATGQVGFHFESPEAYDNRIDTSNVVNGEPVRWYVGHPSDPPLHVVAPRAALRGATNVAQIMLHNVSDAVVEDALARDGVGAGILVSGSSNVTLLRAVVEGNSAAGVEVLGGADVRLRASSVRGNGVGASADSTARFTMDDVLVERNDGDGVRLQAAPNASLLGVRALANRGDGLEAARSPNLTLADGELSDNGGAGAALSEARGANLSGNVLARNRAIGFSLFATGDATLEGNVVRGSDGVRLESSSGNRFRRNAFDPDGGHGFRIADDASLGNDVDTGNRVGGTPVRWYVGLRGAPGAPVVLDGVEAEGAAATDVGQVILHRSSYVVLQGARASWGSRAGILLVETDNVTLRAPHAGGNGREGVLVRASQNVTVEGARLVANGGRGLGIEGSRDARVEGGAFSENGGDGIGVLLSSRVSVRRAEAVSNEGFGLLWRSGDGALLEGLRMRGNGAGGASIESAASPVVRGGSFARNGPVGVALKAVTDATVEDNSLQNHTRAVQLLAVSGSRFASNVVALRPGQTGFHFEDEGSWRNRIATTNVVNGARVQWHYAVRGTEAQPALVDGVEITAPGVTNVAQVMVLDSENLSLSRIRLESGARAGLVVAGSRAVSLLDVEVRGAALDGIRVVASQASVVDSASVRNGGHGLSAQSGAFVRVVNATLAGNDGRGLDAAGSSIDGTRLRLLDNAKEGLHAEGSGPRASALEASRVQRNGGAGVRVVGAAWSGLWDLNVSGNRGGVEVVGAGPAEIGRSLVEHNGDFGVRLATGGHPVAVTNGTLRNHKRALDLVGAARVTLDNNTVWREERQYAIHLDDATPRSIDVRLSNVVDGQPVRWYRHATGVIEGIDATVPGVTNVAQVVLYEPRNATLVSPVATDGRGHGILVVGGSNVTILGATVRDNRGDGVALVGASGARVDGGSVDHDGGAGVRVSGGSAVVTNLTVRAHRGPGLVAEGSGTDAELSRNDVSGGRSDGIVVADGALARVLENRVSDNAGAGVRLVAAQQGTRVERNSVSGHPRGIELERTGFSRIAENDVRMAEGATGLHFADEGSYSNEVPVSNRVNGVPVRWYALLSGTEDAPIEIGAVRVELPGITNVAQVMVYRSSYVRLVEPVASHGAARGIYVLRSSSVEVESATAVGSGVGVHLESTQSSRVIGANVSGSGVGVRLTDSGNSEVARADATGTQVGVRIDPGSRNNRVHGTVATRAGVSVDDPSVRGSRAENLLVDAGLDFRTGVGRTVKFADALAASRFEGERIVEQTWEFGDGRTERRTQEETLRPAHVYASPGTYAARLSARTAEGAVLSDSVLVRVSGPMTAPAAVRAVRGGSVVAVAWQAPSSDGGSDVTAYRVYRGADGETGDLVAEVGPSLQFIDPAAPAEGELHYAVAAVNADGEGPRSAWALATDGAAPSAPGNLTAVPGDGNVSLRWDAPADDGGLPVLRYEVRRADGDAPAEILASVERGRAHLDLAVRNGVPYRYEVLAVNALGPGEPSGAVTARPTALPPPPGNVTALAGDRSVALLWTPPPTDPEAPVLHYRVYRSEAGLPPVLVAQLTDGTSHRDEGLSNIVEYAYSVSTVTRVGEGLASVPVVAAPSPVDATPPLLRAFSPGDGSLTSDDRQGIAIAYADNAPRLTAILYLDGVEVTRAEGRETALAYKPPRPLEPGPHAVHAVLRDPAGLETAHAWSFRLLTPAEREARLEWSNLTMEGSELALGDNITVRAEVRNVGLVHARIEHYLTANDRPALIHVVDLPPGGNETVAFNYTPEAAGEFAISIGGLPPLPLAVIALDEEPAPGDGPGPDSEGGDGEAPPEEDGGFLGVPGFGPALALAAAAVALLARRRQAG